MTEITTVLFDFDGVITDTERQYDEFAHQLMKRYDLPSNFPELCRGVVMDYVFEHHFPEISKEEQESIKREAEEHELAMDFPLVKGVTEFIAYLRANNYKVGIATSSPQVKMDIALKQLGLKDTFGTVVTADRITECKPHPMCYQLAAKELGSKPEECIVFEDSLHGIQAATDAGMRVVGVATSYSEKELKGLTYAVITNFEDVDHVTLLGK